MDQLAQPVLAGLQVRAHSFCELMPGRGVRTGRDIVIQVERMEDGRRRVVSLQEINGMEGDIITSTELFAFERRGIDAKGNVLGDLKPTGIVPAFLREVHARGIDLPIDLFREDGTAVRR